MVHFIELGLYSNDKTVRIEITRIGIMEEYSNCTGISENFIDYIKGRYFRVNETVKEITDKIESVQRQRIELQGKAIRALDK